MKERPILFSGPMVRAILEGRKTMTRRIVKPQPPLNFKNVNMSYGGIKNVPDCKYGLVGDRLWVRETFWHRETFHADYLMDYRYFATDPTPTGSCDPKDYDTLDGYWRKMPSIFMPRDASRITLEIKCVRVERLQDITERDAISEGVEPARYETGPHCPGWRDYIGGSAVLQSARHSFETLWVRINGSESWDSDPWVWAVEFKRV